MINLKEKFGHKFTVRWDEEGGRVDRGRLSVASTNPTTFRVHQPVARGRSRCGHHWQGEVP
jgi:hypothetical protein